MCWPRKARRSAARRTTSPNTAASSPACEKAAELGVRELEVVSDSELLVKQMQGEYRVKNEALKELWEEATDLERRFSRVRYTAVRRAHNELADRLVNEALDGREAPRLYWPPLADVAQLARASACHAEGRGFESHHPLLKAPETGVFVSSLTT